MRPLSQCSALLFDGSSNAADCRFYDEPQRVWHVAAPLNVSDVLSAKAALRMAMDELEAAARGGLHVVLSLSYEAAGSFSASEGRVVNIKPQANVELAPTPWLQALGFSSVQNLTREQALARLKSESDQATVHLTPPMTVVGESDFHQSIAKIRDLIAAGDTYQVNYTFPLVADLLAYAHHPDAALGALYLELVQDLRIPYGAFLKLPHNSVLSCSPELFVALKGDALTCRPMKGTAAVGESDSETTRRAALLAADPKNRSENLMIVDLMRNDLARLPQTERVCVPKLFDVKRYGTVLQMTSTVRSDLTEQPSLNELFDALFPCGSITGAPKRRTMEIIDELEPFARGAYCGAIGFVEPLGDMQMNATFAVPIRTIETTAIPMVNGLGVARWALQCSVGAGITYDSNAADEWDESHLKSRFLTRHGKPFEIIETMRAERNSMGEWFVPMVDAHFKRMSSSAETFGLRVEAVAFYRVISDALAQSAEQLATDNQNVFLRLRVALQTDGRLTVALTSPETLLDRVRFAIHPQRVDSSNPFLRHKTSVRRLYNEVLACASKAGRFDDVFLNERGELTEGARSSLFVLLSGQWYTPPLECGVLHGIGRAQFIAEHDALERVLVLDDLERAERIVLCNALYRVNAVLC